MEKMAIPREWAAKRKIFHQSGLKMCVHIYMYMKSLAFGYHHAHLEDRDQRPRDVKQLCQGPPPTPTPNTGAVGSGKEPSLTHLAHALSISLIKTIDLFILGG